MALGGSTRTGSRGGVGIQAFRQGDARVAAGIGALVCAALFALAVRLSAGELPGPTGIAAVAGVAVLLAGLVLRRGTLATFGLALLGAGYGISLAGRDLDPAAPLFAGGLVATAELAFWALEPGAAVRIGRAATGRRALAVAVVALGAVLCGALLLAAVYEPLRGGAAFGIVGIAAVAAIVGVAVVLARSLRDGVG